MKKNIVKKIDDEINEKTKIPEGIKEKVKTDIFINIILAIIIITYIVFIILGSSGSIKNIRSVDLNIFSIIFLGAAILLFEIAYKKDNGSLALYGIESLMLAIFTLFLPYIIFEVHETSSILYSISFITIAVYYITKSIVIYIRNKSSYMNSISDVKEIVKKEERKRKELVYDKTKKMEDKKQENEGRSLETKKKGRGRP